MKNLGNNYPWQGMLALTIMGLMSLLFIYVAGFFSVTSLDEFYDCFSKGGIALIFGSFFIGICLYCWINFFKDVILKPKEEILYLSKIEDGYLLFINKKGKKFYFDDNKYKVKKFYKVLKTHNFINQILGESTETFDLTKEKRSYWLNCYLPVGNFENLFLLPIVYVILLPGLLSFLMSKGYDKIYGAIWCLIPTYIIIYDLIYKIKLKKNNYKKIDDSAFEASYIGLLASLKISAIVIVNAIMIYVFVKSDGYINKLIVSPFCLCALCGLGHTISDILGNEKVKKTFYKGYIAIFLLYMFGFLSYLTTYIVLVEEQYLMLLFTIPFWGVWIYILYKFFIHKDK